MDVIRGLLRSSLLTELGDDEDRVGRVRGAAQDLAAQFAGELRTLVPYAVVAAIDELVPATAAPLAAAENALLERWETFRNAFPGQPTEILRAVALAAVADVVDNDDAMRQAAWYALRTATECLPAGRWANPVTDLAAEWEGKVRSSITGIWSPAPAPSRLRMPTIPKAEDEKIPIDTPLRNRASELEDAASYNVFAQQLQGEFAEHVEQVIGVSEVLAAEAHRRSVTQLKDFATGLGARLREALAAQEQTMEAVWLRSELLWWRETIFSTRLSRSYADLDPADVAIAAAVDLHNIVPLIAPLAVEHLLADLVHDAAGSAEVTVAALAAAGQVDALPGSANIAPATLVDAVCGGTQTPLVPSGQTLPAGRAAVLLFRDLQARRLAATAPPEQPGDVE
ncbi:GTPase-associated system all-helical protein GASH [Micromonospora sp. S-DT3-3-22]|uniref:GTPase-associated system all-helical protein GASH n=1 Tax=Micromonospora sp. S-DT3-3-22 TaxID=2755359 RepID=UPI00188F4A3A|nr:GTPase-associated system all-helical protein GASH [Micromonospora sp. S-DT3-3-22]